MILLKHCLATSLMAALALAPCTISGCQIVQVIKANHCKKAPPMPSPARTVTVAGEVRNPGLVEFPPYGGLTIQKVIAISGGIAPESLSLTSTSALTGKTAVDNRYNEYLRSRAVTLTRNEVTYILPAEIIDSTEFGKIRLTDRDVVAVVHIQSLSVNNESDKTKDVVDPDSNPLKTVILNGTTSLEKSEFTDDELRRLTTPNTPTLVATPGDAKPGIGIGQNARDLIELRTDTLNNLLDLNQGPAFVRLTRHATVDGLPQVFIIPLTQGVADDLKDSLFIRGGDMLTFLPPGLDPLVLTSNVAEEQTMSALARLRSTAGY